MKGKIIKKIIKGVAVASGWILIWQLLSMYVGKQLLVPGPWLVFLRLLTYFGSAKFWEITLITILRIAIGFSLGTVAGVILAVLTARFKALDTFLKPAQTIIRATPIASFIILALVWIKGGNIPSFISFLMVMPIVWVNVYEGIRETDPKLLQMAQVYNLSRFEKIKYIYIHSVLPFFATAATMSMGLAWKAGIAAEVLALPELAIGRAIYDSKIYLETVDLFSWSVVVILMSIILEKAIAIILNKVKPTRITKKNEESK